MHINNINNNVSFSKLHIPSTKADKIALEKFLKTSPETLKEALADIDRESGEDHVYLKTGFEYNTGAIPVVIAGKGDNILASRRINASQPEHMKTGFEKFVDAYITTTILGNPSKPKPNEEVDAIINKYV